MPRRQAIAKGTTAMRSWARRSARYVPARRCLWALFCTLTSPCCLSLQTQRNTNTLAPSFASISTKKLDLEFSVDPLFKKTSADFDEGGAGGLLMNHLGIDGEGKLVFDAGDAGLDDDEDEDEVEAAEGDVDGVKAARAADTRVAIDALKAKFLPFLAANPDELLSRPISTTLKNPLAARQNEIDLQLTLLLSDRYRCLLTLDKAQRQAVF